MQPVAPPSPFNLNVAAVVLALTTLGGCQPTPPNLSPSPPTRDFGAVYVGTESMLNASWQNSGQTDATVTQLTFGGANAANFKTISGFPAQGKAAGEYKALLGFAPTATGQFTAIATPVVKEPNATAQAVTLQGEGVAQLAKGDLTIGGQPIRIGQPVNFGRVAAGAVSPVVKFDLVNPIGNQDITVTKIEFSSATQGFTVTAPAVPFKVNKNGGRTTVSMTFKPPAWNNPPREKVFRAGVTFFEARGDTMGAITKSAAGVALCGVGYFPPDPPEIPVTNCP